LQERLSEAEALAERLNDEGRLGRVSAFMARNNRYTGKLDAALASGNRALEIAIRREDLESRLYAATGLLEAHYLRGDLSRAIEMGGSILATLPSDWVLRSLGGSPTPIAVHVRIILMDCLMGLGRFGEAAALEAETSKLAEKTQQAFSIALVHQSATGLCVAKGEWAKARSCIERWLAVVRPADITHFDSQAVANSALVQAQLGEKDEAMIRLEEAEVLHEQRVARGNLGYVASIGHVLGRACLLLGRIEDARRLASRALEASK